MRAHAADPPHRAVRAADPGAGPAEREPDDSGDATVRGRGWWGRGRWRRRWRRRWRWRRWRRWWWRRRRWRRRGIREHANDVHVSIHERRIEGPRLDDPLVVRVARECLHRDSGGVRVVASPSERVDARARIPESGIEAAVVQVARKRVEEVRRGRPSSGDELSVALSDEAGEDGVRTDRRRGDS